MYDGLCCPQNNLEECLCFDELLVYAEEAGEQLAMFTKFCDEGGIWPSEKRFWFVDAPQVTFYLQGRGLTNTRLSNFFLVTRSHLYTKALNKKLPSRERKKHLSGLM